MTYAAAGVDSRGGQAFVRGIRGAIESTYEGAPGKVLADRAGFAGMLDAAFLKDYEHPVLVSSADGVGTKLKLAQLFDRHETVGIDLVAMCANDLLVTGARPLFFLDYIATGKLNQARMTTLVEGIAAGCREAGCALLGGETAEHPDTMGPDEYDLGGFITGVVERDRAIRGESIEVGDRLIGVPSSGIHSNGLSLVRKLFLKDGVELPEAEHDLEFLRDQILLRPTIIYERALRPLLDDGLPIRGMAHITGGGFYENVPRMLPEELAVQIDPGAWERPDLFRVIQEHGAIAEEEMFSVFNMGVGLVLAVPAEAVPEILGRLESGLAQTPIAQRINGRAPAVIGEVIQRGGREEQVFLDFP